MPNEERGLVLDASAVLSGKRPSAIGGPLFVPHSVLGEVAKRGRDQRAVEYLLATGLDAREPSPEARARVEAAAKGTGDARRLSQPDRDVLALALDLDAEVATDDYSIQNVATVLKIPYRTIAQRGIREVIHWQLRCIGCRKTFASEVPDCDICGSPVKTVRAGGAKKGPRSPGGRPK